MPVEQFTLTPERIAEAGHLIYSNPWIPKVRWPQSAQIHGDDCGPTPAQLPFLLYFGAEAFFGGAAGPGKSWALLAAAAMFVDHPGYHALLLRRTYADLAKPGALIERSKEWWKSTDAKWSEKEKKWTFPSSATISFGYLEHEDDKYQYQSAEYQFCVARGTKIKMPDGTLKPIERIRVGDFVLTLEGPRRVSRTYRFGRKPVVKVTSSHGDAVVSATHRLMISPTTWACPNVLRSIAARTHCTTLELSPGKSQELWPHDECSFEGRQPVPITPVVAEWSASRQATFVLSGGAGSDCGLSCDVLQEASLLPEWSSLAMLHEPCVRRSSRSMLSEHHQRVRQHASTVSLPQDSRRDYQYDCGSCGERSRPCEVASQGRIPSQVDAATQSLWRSRSDDPKHTHGRILLSGEWCYAHPYTMESRLASQDARLDRVSMALAGEEEVFDLRVESASHYILSNGIIASNCGFDELTQFSEQQYLYLFSRLRKLEGSDIPLRMRAASNPGGPKGGRGHEWVKARFVDPESAVAPFFRGVLSTNFFLDRKQYLQSLSHLDPVTRGQLERGDWSSVPGGRFFREWFKRYRCYRDGHGMLRLVMEDGDKTGIYLHECYTFIAADIACSMKQTADYTAIGVFAVTPGKQLLILDMIRERTRVDMIVPLIAQACKDYSPMWVGIEDAGFQQAILAEAKRNRTIPAVRGLKHMGLDKLVRATPAMIRASEGQVYVPSNSEDSRIVAQQQVPMDCKWVEQFVSECVTFTGNPDDGKDDMVDSFAYACRQLDMHGLLGPIVVSVEDDPVPRLVGGTAAAIGYDDGYRASGFVEMFGR